ncbi:MAG: 3-methylornithine--L-lysine ligase PylC [Thermodesulfobacteriota bacterium]
MLVAVAGGNLQGVEVAYLARKAGWDVLVVDKNANAPASGMCHWFVQQDLCEDKHLGALFAKVDFLIPALENDAALASLVRCAHTHDIPFAFDPAAYKISSSKQASDDLFARAGIPIPLGWPHCHPPVIVKPSRASGSEDITIFNDRASAGAFLEQAKGEWVAQAYVEGSTYSLEVMGRNGDYFLPQVTDLHMDEQYDCRAVTTPSLLPAEQVTKLENISIEIAQLIDLNGLMDVEVVESNGALRVLEIDARFPSQTPTAVYHSTGFNMVAALGDLFMHGQIPAVPDQGKARGVVYEHIHVSGDILEFAGEHIMSSVGRLRRVPDFFEADEAITNYAEGRNDWVATLIITGKDRQKAIEKRSRVLGTIRSEFNLRGEIAEL